MPIRGAGTKIYVSVEGTWWAIKGLSSYEQADASVGAGDTSELFDQSIVNPGSSTVGALSLSCTFFSNDDLYRWLLEQEVAGASVQVTAVLGVPVVRIQSKAAGPTVAIDHDTGALTFGGTMTELAPMMTGMSHQTCLLYTSPSPRD